MGKVFTNAHDDQKKKEFPKYEHRHTHREPLKCTYTSVDRNRNPDAVWTADDVLFIRYRDMHTFSFSQIFKLDMYEHTITRKFDQARC